MVYPKKNEMIQYSRRKFSYWISYHQIRYSDEFVRRSKKNKKGRSVGGILFYYPNILKIFFPLRQVVRVCPLTKLSKNIINETQEVYREGVYNIPKNNFCQK